MRLLGADQRVRELRAAARRLRLELEHSTVAGAGLDSTTGRRDGGCPPARCTWGD